MRGPTLKSGSCLRAAVTCVRASFAGSLLVILSWCAAGAAFPSQAVAQVNPDTCTENGGTAYCVGPEVGPFKYQVSDGNIAVAQGASEAGTIAAYNQAFVTAFAPCTYNVSNNLPPYQPAQVGNGNASTGNYSQALNSGSGQYWVMAWTLSTETMTERIPLVYSGTRFPSSGCSVAFGPFGVYVERVRDVECPGGYTGPYRPNVYAAPTNAYCYRPGNVVDPTKNLGPMCPAAGASSCSTANTPNALIGNPVNPGTGNKFQPETDYVGQGPMPLGFVRYYNALQWTGIYAPGTTIGFQTALGLNWSSTYDRVIRFQSAVLFPTAYAYRPDGRTLHFKLANGKFVPDGDVADQLVQLVDGSGNTTGWRYTIAATDEVETYDASGALLSLTNRAGLTQTLGYDASGRLSTVTDPFGEALTLAYNASNQLHTVTNPAGGIYTYTYNSVGNVSSVTYPDSTVRTYVYNESAYTSGFNEPYALTGIVDESNSRYATYQYDGQQRVISSSHAGGADQFLFSYGTNQTAVTDPLGKSRTFSFSTLLGVARNTSIDQPCNSGCAGAGAATTYDSSSNVASRTDFNGNVTTYNNDLTRNLELSRTEAYNTTSGRTTTTQWHSKYRLPTVISVYAGNSSNGTPIRTTSLGYDSMGNLLTKTVTDPATSTSRTWTYTYDGYGRVLTAKGPRTDLNATTTYAYYTCTTGHQCGQLQTVTDAMGHVTTYNTYNAYGLPLTITDPNGVVTTLTYDTRMRLTSRQVGTETTGFSYWPTGLLKQITLPDSSYVMYTYDGAHRLTQINDELGNKILYTLDAMGNRTAENSYDPSSSLHHTHTRVINALNELYQDVNAAGTAAVTTTFAYDNNGNQTRIDAPLSRNTTNAYDPLNRLSQVTDPNSGVTKFGYDAEDNLTSVIDPRTLTTSYGHNGFGDVTSQVSPDTGTTRSTYDSGGNLATSTDARGAVSTYAYDALNRVTSVAYKVGSVTDQTIAFGYDSGTYGKGRLTSTSDANHALAWTYDFMGRVVGKGLTLGAVKLAVGYGYTNGDQTSLVTPSNQSVTYGYNSNHQITSIAVNGTTVLSNVTYEPFGGVNGWKWGDGTTTTRTFNEDGLISQIVTAGVTLGYTFDNANRIGAISDSSNSALSWTYGYDPLDRLTSATTSATTDGWTYDANGNRLTQTGTKAITFSVSPTSNQLTSTSGGLTRTYAYDAAGNATAFGGIVYGYNDRGRMRATSQHTTNYIYNALGQMIEKPGNSGTTLFMQDEAGHLIGEYSSTGALVQETIWLGDIPVATLRPNGSSVSIYYVHTDHLNAPRKVQQPTTDKLAWRWDADPFGTTAPNQNPASLGTFVYNLRFPGQYYMAETGLNQNVFRDFDPAVGRYVESDPGGLAAGINTYVYVDSDPILLVDPLGLAPKPPRPGSIRNVACNDEETTRCRSTCAAQGKTMESCKRVEKWLIRRATQSDSGVVITLYGWKKINESCSCNEPNACQAHPVACALAVLAVGVGICLAPEVTIPALAVP
jgi:RHS repeat-associated protein